MTKSPRLCPESGRSSPARLAAWLCALAATAGGGGCGPPGPPPAPRPVSRADNMLVMLSPPAAMNWDSQPGADGLQLQILLFQNGPAAPVLVNGTLEFLLFEGNVSAEDFSKTKPFKTWRFSGDQLKPLQARLRAGWGYGLRLGWGRPPPAGASITLFAQYLDTGGSATAYGRMVIPMKTR